MTPARPGPVSIATLRTQDLLESFADCLESLAYDNGDADKYGDLIKEANDTRDKVDQFETYGQIGEDNIDLMDTAGDIIYDLVDALNNYAPEDHYFGSHPGDGAEFGFYPIDEEF